MSAVFEQLSPEAQQSLSAESEFRVLEPGEILFHQGSAASDVYVVSRGLLQVTVRGPTGEEREVALITRGQLVGELALLLDSARIATARALLRTQVLVFPKESMLNGLQRNPQFGLALSMYLAGRLRAAQAPRLRGPPLKTAAILPVSPGFDSSIIAKRLALAEMRREGLAVLAVLTASKVDDALGPGASQRTSDDRVEHWLDEVENRHHSHIYLADATMTEWTRRCIARADRLHLMADANADPAPSELEQNISPEGSEPALTRRELILVHPDGTERPGNTKGWLSLRPGVRHHHVRVSNEGDWARLSRRLTGKAVGLVLGGGGARGLAHVGVIRALSESGIPIDIIGGASSGGGVAALYAAGYRGEEITEGIRAAWRDSGVLRSYTFPSVSLLRTNKAARVIRERLGDTCMEDLWTPCYVVATNLTRSRVERLDRGPAWQALMATSAIPGVFPPVIIDGDVLVDGGVSDNLPVSGMECMSPGVIIASDVGGSGSVRVANGIDTMPTGLSALRENFGSGESPRVPSLRTLLVASASSGSVLSQSEARSHVDLYIHHRLKGYKTLDFDHLADVEQVGYEETLRMRDSAELTI